ncbi:rCG48896 [Rattus norvegicus]|uniref:RCG48896 n=1 Tax=Rattus norvegicus TaxID=10116 RepID=A6IGA0_RAT|nr:rCG48896 [Rattus norvegicus]
MGICPAWLLKALQDWKHPLPMRSPRQPWRQSSKCYLYAWGPQLSQCMLFSWCLSL